MGILGRFKKKRAKIDPTKVAITNYGAIRKWQLKEKERKKRNKFRLKILVVISSIALTIYILSIGSGW